MTGGFWPSALVAALFAVHPLRVESVAWITERKDVLSGLFFMLILGAYLEYLRHRSSLLRLAVTVLFALGLMAKGMLVTLPFVLLLLDYWPLGRFAEDSLSRPRIPHCNGGDCVRGKTPAGSARPIFASLAAGDREAPPVRAGGHRLCGHPVGPAKAAVPFALLPLQWRIGNALVSYVVYFGRCSADGIGRLLSAPGA